MTTTVPTTQPVPTVGRGGVVPYIVMWSVEQTASRQVVLLRDGAGIGYPDELSTDRDHDGVLWTRMQSRPGQGRPLYRQLHPLRQRRAMRRLLCQVCAEPAEYTDKGHLWLLVDQDEKWPNWPESLINPYPPVCMSCARISVRQCPPLRRSPVAVRAHSTLYGVIGIVFREGNSSPIISEQDDGTAIPYGDPAIRWTQAIQLTRSLFDCKVIDLNETIT